MKLTIQIPCICATLFFSMLLGDVCSSFNTVHALRRHKLRSHSSYPRHSYMKRKIRDTNGRTKVHSYGGRKTLNGSSSSPVEPIKPLLNLGSNIADGLTLPPHPVFDDGAPKNVSGLQGNTVYLHCLVHNLGNKSVSWIRQRDLHILTVGTYTYATDQRYQVVKSKDSNDWILKIKSAQVRDSGNYECQVSSKSIQTYVVHLQVYAAPEASIVGAPDMHVDKGSTINLTCIIKHSPETTGYIFWYHNGKVINFDSPRGGITVVTERGNTTTGYLLMQDARPSDNGNYSCKPSNTGSASARVHVLEGEFPAAMQTSGSFLHQNNKLFSIATSQFLINALLYIYCA